MVYQALYRKYRSKSFADVMGQDAIVKTLKGQIIGKRISHAYLFCGTRGTGKTSVAKIFAKAVNCQNPQDGSPCGQCQSCENIQNDLDMNVMEIDAASNNGVDNIRDIRDEVRYTPVGGNYKVYIIDEVHMLSTGAFNALLKTLEEPPPHVIFVLATTDPQKIPPTVLSRCQRFDFKRIPQAILTDKLTAIAHAEGIEAEAQALRYIAQVADGAFRDAESILDQCISFYAGEAITLQKVLDVVGAVDDTVYFQLAAAISDFETDTCMQLLDHVLNEGKDIHQFVLSFIRHLRHLLLAAVSGSGDVLDMAPESARRYVDACGAFGPQRLSQLIRQFSELSQQMKYAQNPRILCEVAFIKTCNPVLDESYDGLLSRLMLMEKNLRSIQESGVHPSAHAEAPQAPTATQTPASASASAQPPEKTTAVSSSKTQKASPTPTDKDIPVLWEKVKATFTAGTDAIMAQTTARCAENGVFTILCPNSVYADFINKKRSAAIADALQKETGKLFQIKAIASESADERPTKNESSADDYEKLTKQLQDAGLDFIEIH